MRKLIILFAAILIVAGFTGKVMAQTENTAAGAKILTAMTITENSALHFGTMTVPSTVATVILAPAGTVTKTGTITLLAQTPVSAAAGYDITGDISATYAITLPGSTTITNGTPADDMTVNTFTCSYAGLTSVLSGAGLDAFTVGATLNLASGQSAGVYAGTFDVTVAYN